MFRILMLLVFISGCSSSATSDSTGGSSPIVAKGARMIGMDTNDASSDFTFAQSFSAAQSVGVSAGTLHLVWNADEAAGSGASSGTFTDVGSALASANAYYPLAGAKLSITIAPIDTGGNFFPSDLNGLTIDNANVITRFNAFLDWTLAKLTTVSLVSIQIGNEVDAPSGAGTAAYWTQYKTFMTAVVAHLHSAKPGVKIGSTFTLYGLVGQGAHGAVAGSGILALLSTLDEVGLTYYPLNADFTVKTPNIVAADFNTVVALTGTKPIYIQEAGYPTSSIDASSEALQAQFIDALFAAWDAHASVMPFVALLRMNDLSASAAQSTATSFGLGGNAAFVGYLQTLGLRTYASPSAVKLAWGNLQARTHERGW